MGFVTVSPNPSPVDFLKLVWPATPTLNENQTFVGTSFSQFNYMAPSIGGPLTKMSNGQSKLIWADSFAGAGGAANMQMYGGQPCLGYVGMSGAGVNAYRFGVGAGCAIAPFATTEGVELLSELPQAVRVARYKFALVRGTGVWDDNAGIAMIPYNGANVAGQRWYNRPAGADQPGGIALIGDGLGGMNIITYTKGSAAPGNVRSTFPIAPGVFGSQADWNFIEFEFVNSGPGRDATCTVFINDAQVANIPFSTGATNLEAAPFGTGAGTNIVFIPLLKGGANVAAQDFYYGAMEFTFGRFRKDGSSV